MTGPTGPSYTLASSEEGMTIQMRVSFTDDAGKEETLTSAATAVVSGLPPEPLTAGFEATPSSHDGENAITFELRFSEEVRLSLQDPAGPFVHGHRWHGEEGAATGAGQQHWLADNASARLQR